MKNTTQNDNYTFELKENYLTGIKDELYLRDIFIGYYKLGDLMDIEKILNLEVYPGVGISKDYDKVYPTYRIENDKLYVDELNLEVVDIRNPNFNKQILNILHYKPNYKSERFNYYGIVITNSNNYINHLSISYKATVKRLVTLKATSKHKGLYYIKPLFI